MNAGLLKLAVYDAVQPWPLPVRACQQMPLVLVMTRGSTAAAQRAEEPLQRLAQHANAQRSDAAEIGRRGAWQLFCSSAGCSRWGSVQRATACM